MKRRDAIKSILSFVPLGVAFGGLSAMGIRFITPGRKESEQRVFAINLKDLQVNETRRIRDLKGKELLVVRTGEREVKAISTVCTHLGCTVYWQKKQNRFYCPCHQGVFDPDGAVVSGPAPKALDSYKIELEGDNVFIYFKHKES